MIQNLGCGESTGAAPVKLFPTAIQVGSSGATTSGATSQLKLNELFFKSHKIYLMATIRLYFTDTQDHIMRT